MSLPLQVVESHGDVLSHGYGVSHLRGLGVGQREPGRHQQLQKAEPHSVRALCPGGELHPALSALQHRLPVCCHRLSGL